MELEQVKQERKETRIVRNGIGDIGSGGVYTHTPTEWNCFTLVNTHTQHSARVWFALKLKDYQQTTVYLCVQSKTLDCGCACVEHAMRLAPHAKRNLLQYDGFSYFIPK